MPSYGLIFKTPHANERRFFAPNRILATLPPWIDISAGRGPYLDQSAEGSCGPNSFAECVNFDQKVEGLPVVLVSRQQVYWCTRFLQGDTAHDTGVENKTMLAAANQYGFAPESLWPYDLSNMTTKPPQNVFDAAIPNRIMDYAVVPQNLKEIQGTIVARRPFIFGFSVYQQIESEQAAKTGIILDPGAGETPIGGHDMTPMGFNASGSDLPGVLLGNRWPNNTLKMSNHWTNADGSPWGDGGYGYISFNYALNPGLSGDFWVINTIPGSGVVPPPPPPPPGSPCTKVARALFRGVQAAYDEMAR